MNDDDDDSMELLRRGLRAAFEDARRADKPPFKAMYRVDTASLPPTGMTTHYFGNEELPPAKALAIGVFEPGAGYYLVHFNDAGAVLTDTFHETLERAFAQAKWEFSIPTEAWTAVESA